jgi:S1-C subfamily serine protease
MKTYFRAVLMIVLVCVLVKPSYAQQNLSKAIVKIYTVYTEYDYDMPWQIAKQKEMSGSGCIISGKRILTNAHVIADQRFVQVKRAGEVKKYVAEVEFVAHDCDLAILKVNNDSFFTGADPIAIGALAKMQDKVAVYGFPEGGDELCITEGVVSRIEYQHYAHSDAYLLACQIDAAINVGNSGGPVIKNGEIVGIAFQKQDSGEKIGYMIPAPVIHHFMKDIKGGVYHGIPSLEGFFQSLENPSLRSKYHMNDKQTGVLVTYIPKGSPIEGILKYGDVILSIDGKTIENDGTIPLRETERTDAEYIVHNKFIGDSVQLRILRGGLIMNVDIVLTMPITSTALVPFTQYDKAPTYYIVGGLVFQPLTGNYLSKWAEQKDAPVHLVNYFHNGKRSQDRMQVIVLTQVLGDEITESYSDLTNNVITQVNGIHIISMEDLVRAIEFNEKEYHVIVDEYGNQIVLDQSRVREANQRMFNKYGIPSDKSKDLKALSVKQ